MKMHIFKVSLVLLLACGGSDETPPLAGTDDGGVPFSDGGVAAVARPDKIPWDWPTASTSSGGTAGTQGQTGGQGGASIIMATVSNTPGAAFENASVGLGQKIRLVSSNLLIDAPPRELFSRWFGEVRNESTTPLCLTKFVVRFEAENNVQLLVLDGFLDGAAYKSSASASLPTECLTEGMPAAGWTIRQGGTYFDVSKVKRVVYSFTPFDPGSITVVPHPNHPTLDAKVVGKSIEGQLRAKQTIHNIGLTFYPVMANGLIEEYLSDTHLETLFSGSAWAFDTRDAPSPFVRYLSFTGWIEGAKSSFYLPQTPEGSRWLAVMQSHQARRDLWVTRKGRVSKSLDDGRANVAQP